MWPQWRKHLNVSKWSPDKHRPTIQLKSLAQSTCQVHMTGIVPENGVDFFKINFKMYTEHLCRHSIFMKNPTQYNSVRKSFRRGMITIFYGIRVYVVDKLLTWGFFWKERCYPGSLPFKRVVRFQYKLCIPLWFEKYR